MSRVKNQPLKWHGGKSDLAHWIHSLAPAGYTHRNIVFAGGLGEFWNWEPVDGISEAVNDIDDELMNLYAVINSKDAFAEFARRVNTKPFSDTSFKSTAENPHLLSRDATELSICKAVNFFIRYRMSRQGLGKCYATPTTRTRRGMNENVSAWLSAVDGLPDCHARLRRVELRNMDALDFIAAYDHPKALFYCDPPYKHDTRKAKDAYGKFEMTDEGHALLLLKLTTIKGKFMLSGYHSDVYDRFASEYGWHVSEREAPLNSSAKKEKEIKVEVIWTNYQPPEIKK